MIVTKTYIHFTNYNIRAAMVKCPRCGKEGRATGKEWKFGQFDAVGYRCDHDDKPYSAYYRDGKLSHTVPKSK